MADLFSATESNPFAPLAERMRPKTLAGYIGQSHILGQGNPCVGPLSRINCIR